MEPETTQPKETKKRTVSPNFRKKIGCISRKIATAINLSVNHNMTPKDALILADNGKVPNKYQVSRLKIKCDKYRLTQPSMAKLAHHVVKDVLKGVPMSIPQQSVGRDGQVIDYQEIIPPTYTNRLAAASMVYDRVDPVVQRSVSLNINLMDIHPVDLSRYGMLRVEDVEDVEDVGGV